MIVNNQLQQNMQLSELSKRMLFGAITGTGLFILFIIFTYFFADAKGHLDIRIVSPLSTITIAGAFGGAFHYLMDRLRRSGGWLKITANILSVLFFLFICWMSMVLGFAAIGMWH